MHYDPVSIKVQESDEYKEWFKEQRPKLRAQIQKRVSNIINYEHFGTIRKLDSNLAEIKFNDGTRIYFTRIELDGKTILLLLGGNKNGQDKDIKKAKSLLT